MMSSNSVTGPLSVHLRVFLKSSRGGFQDEVIYGDLFTPGLQEAVDPFSGFQDPAHVSGEAGSFQVLDMGSEVSVEERLRTTGAIAFDQTATDPRVAGRWTASMTLDDLASTFSGSLNLFVGSVLLENEAGFWSGPLTGYQAAEEPYPASL